MTFKTVFLTANLALFVFACSNAAKTSFYQLQAIDTIKLDSKPQFKQPITLLINPIKFPDYLDHPQIVIRENQYKLQLSENHQWAEPLKNEFSRIFIANINHRIAPGRTVDFSELKNKKPDIHLSIEVLQLDVSTQKQAVLSVTWAYWKDKTPQKINRVHHTFKASIKDASFEAKVEAQSLVIAQFSDYVVKILSTSNKGGSNK